SLPDRQLDDLEVERLEYVIEGAELHRVHGRLHSAVGREQHHRHLGVDLAYTGKQLETRHARHLEIGEDQVELLGLEPLERLFATLGAHRLDPHALEQDLQHAAHLPLVVDHQHLRHRGPRATGSSTRNVVPRPTALSTDTVPWCAWTTRWTSARPRPVPPLRRVKNGVKPGARASTGASAVGSMSGSCGRASSSKPATTRSSRSTSSMIMRTSSGPSGSAAGIERPRICAELRRMPSGVRTSCATPAATSPTKANLAAVIRSARARWSSALLLLKAAASCPISSRERTSTARRSPSPCAISWVAFVSARSGWLIRLPRNVATMSAPNITTAIPTARRGPLARPGLN